MIISPVASYNIDNAEHEESGSDIFIPMFSKNYYHSTATYGHLPSFKNP